MAVVYPATNYREAVDVAIVASNQFHTVLNGTIDEDIDTYEGNGKIPSVAKALHESMAYRAPLDWEPGVVETDLMQPRLFEDGNTYVPRMVPAQMEGMPDYQHWKLWMPSNVVSMLREERVGSDIQNGVLEVPAYHPGSNNLMMFVDGSLAREGYDYEELDTTHVKFLVNIDTRAVIIIYVGNYVSGDVDIVQIADLIRQGRDLVDELEDLISQNRLVTGPNTTVKGELSSFDNTTGTLLGRSGLFTENGNLWGHGAKVETRNQNFVLTKELSGCVLVVDTSNSDITITLPTTQEPLTKNTQAVVINVGTNEVKWSGGTQLGNFQSLAPQAGVGVVRVSDTTWWAQ